MPRPFAMWWCAVAAVSPVLAQVPHGSCVIGVISNTAPSEGLWLCDRSGTTTPITGLVAAGSPNANVNAVAIDPIDGRLWIGSSISTALAYVRLTGSTVSQYTVHGNVPSGSISAITFDDNGNPVVSNSQSGVVHFDRRLGTATAIGFVATGHNALTRDLAGNLYVGNGTTGQIHVLTKNFDGTFQVPQPFGSTATSLINGLAFVPTNVALPDELWAATGSTLTSPLYRLAFPAGGAGTALPSTPGACNAITYDQLGGDVLFVTQAGLDRVGSLDRSTGLPTVIAQLQGGNVGTPAAIDSHDDTFGSVRALPRILNGNLGPFDLELGATCPPGSLALVGLVSPFVNVLAAGVVGADGRLSVTFPNVTLNGPLQPGALQFAVAYFDASFQLVIGDSVFWPEL